MKFLYYVVNLETKEIRGTNDMEEAAEFEKTDEYAVINREGWQMLWDEGTKTIEPVDILPIESNYEDEDEDEDEEAD